MFSLGSMKGPKSNGILVAMSTSKPDRGLFYKESALLLGEMTDCRMEAGDPQDAKSILPHEKVRKFAH